MLHLTSWQATTFLIGEYVEGEMRDNPVFTVADGLFWLYQSVERNSIVRKMQVMKLRGQESVPGLHTFRITDAGLQTFPRTFGLAGESGQVKGRRRLSTEATRRAVTGWGMEVLCAEPREYSSSLTAVLVPDGYDADRVRDIILDGFDMSLGTGLGKMKGKIFRIGHLGHFNDLMLCGTLCGVEMGLHRAGIPHRAGGVAAALEYLGALDNAA